MADSSITKKALAEAMKDLMQQVPLSQISISDICQRCQMHRKSFYYHFKDKYDLVNWIFYSEFFTAFARQDRALDIWECLGETFDYFYQNKRFYKNALSVQGQNSFYEYFGEIITPLISERIDQLFPQDEDHDFYVGFFADAIRNALVDWMSKGAKVPPKKLVELVRRACYGVAHYIMWAEAQEGGAERPNEPPQGAVGRAEEK